MMLKETLLALYAMLAPAGPTAAVPAATAAPAAAAPAADRLTADQVVQRIQRFYERTDRLTAKFRQRYTNTTFGKTTTSTGKVYIKKPGKMRWDYYERVAGKRRVQKTKSFISDGETLWAVEHDNKQAFKKGLHDDLLPVAITFLYGKGDLARDFEAALDEDVTFDRKSGEYVVRLTPRQVSAQYKTLWLVVSPDDFRVRRSIVLEASGNTNEFTFYEPDLATKVKDSWFTVRERVLKRRKFRIIKPDKRPDHK